MGELNLLDENIPAEPSNICAITKFAGILACRYYREQKGVFAIYDILLNHESTLCASHFLSCKILIGLARIARGLDHVLELRSLYQ